MIKVAVVRGPSLNKFEMQYYEPLAKRHELVCFASTKPIHDIENINLPIVKLPCWGQILSFPGATKALFWFFGDPQGLIGLGNKLSGFDIAHTAELFSYYTHQALLAKKKGKVKKVVATVSENIPFNQEWYPRQKALKEFARKNLDNILAISSSSKQAMIKEGYPRKKIAVVPHGLNLDKFKPQKKDEKLAKKLEISRDDLVVLSAGRLVPEKGFADLLQAANELTKDNNLRDENLKFLIIGVGPEKKNLVQLRDRLRLKKKVVFSRGLPYDEMVKVYNLADIFVLASKPAPGVAEQFGMVLAEAMACGVPVISTRCGATPETVGEAGILVKPGEVGSLTQSLKDLILNQEKRKRLSKKGRKRVIENFSLEIVSRKIERVYKKALQT